MSLDIYSKGSYPADALSNFAAHDFTLDGVLCRSMEGFLQSLKYRNSQRQRAVCQLVGGAAKRKGKHKYWWKLCGRVWWQGRAYKRTAAEFQELLDRAYEALFENPDFRRALRDSGWEVLTHTMGNSDPKKTILTEEEFTCRLTRLRASLAENGGGEEA